MTSEADSTAQLDHDLRQVLRSTAGGVTPRPHVMTEIALRDAARRRQRRELRLVCAGLATVALVVGAVLIGPLDLDRSHDSLPADPRPAEHVQPRDPAPREITATIRLPGYDASAAFVALGDVFVRLRRPVPTIVKVDPATRSVRGSVQLPKDARPVEGLDPVVARGSLWWPAERVVYRIDPRSMTVTAAIPVDNRLAPVASDGERVWTADGDGIAQIDTATNTLSRHTRVGEEPAALVFAGGSLWAATGTTVVQLDPDESSVLGRIAMPGKTDVLSMLAVGQSVWVAIDDLDRLVRLTPEGDIANSVRMPGGSSIFDEFDPQLGSGSDGRTLWSMTADKELVAVDIATTRVVDRILMSTGPYHSQVAVLGATVWVPLRGTSSVALFRWQDG